MKKIDGITVIIPVYNDAIALRKCLQSLIQQSYSSEKIELIVVDNGSTHSPIDVVNEFKNVHFLIERKTGSYAARNAGIEAAKYSHFAFIDSDCIADKDWLRNGINKLIENPEAGLIGGKVGFLFSVPDKPNAVEVYDSITYFKQDEYIQEKHFSGAGNLFTSKNIFDKVGLFNSDMKSGGDREWGNRVYNTGLQLIYSETAIIFHPARHLFSELSKKTKRVAGGVSQIDNSNNIQMNSSLIIRALFPPIKRIIKVFKNRSIKGIWMKLKVSSIIFSLKYIGIYEQVRLAIGFSPKRS